MDFRRASEIVESDENIRVLYNGTPVWIESLNANNNSATIKPLSEPWVTSQVPITELEEN